VRSALQLADENHIKSIAFPAISTGIFGYPLAAAAEVIIRTAVDYVAGETGLERVVVCLYGHTAYEVFSAELTTQTS